MRVAQAHDYKVVATLWRRRIGNGLLECRMLRSPGHAARRIIQLRAEYEERGVLTTQVCQVHAAEEEKRDALRLEGVILAASARPDDASSLLVVERPQRTK